MPDFNSIRFQPNRPLLREISAERLNKVLEEIRRNRPLPGRGITLRQEGFGVRIDALSQPQQTSAATAISYPFRVLRRVDPETNNTYVGVSPESYVYSGLPAAGAIVPSGVLTDPTDENDQGWQAAAGIKYIWLELEADGGANSIQFGGEADFDVFAPAWDSSGKAYLESDNSETFPLFVRARKIIAEIVEVDEAITVKQYMKAHQYATDVVVNGLPGIYYFDTSAGLPPAPEE